MNASIQQHFDAIESHLLQSLAFKSYTIIRSEIAFSEGKLRIKSSLQDGGTAEFFIYICETNGSIALLKYSFHWQDEQAQLIRRWDNDGECSKRANHLPGADFFTVLACKTLVNK